MAGIETSLASSNGPVVWVTGAASGIGRALTEMLVASGAPGRGERRR